MPLRDCYRTVKILYVTHRMITVYFNTVYVGIPFCRYRYIHYWDQMENLTCVNIFPTPLTASDWSVCTTNTHTVLHTHFLMRNKVSAFKFCPFPHEIQTIDAVLALFNVTPQIQHYLLYWGRKCIQTGTSRVCVCVCVSSSLYYYLQQDININEHNVVYKKCFSFHVIYLSHESHVQYSSLVMNSFT